MNVYLLYECEQFEPSRVINVYASLESAFKAGEEKEIENDEMEIPDKYYIVLRHEVIEK